MSKGKVIQVKKMLTSDSASSVNGMFEEMMGVKDCDVGIILPKFVLVRNTCRHIYKILVQFVGSVFMSDFPECAQSMTEIKAFADELKQEVFFDEKEAEETEEKYENMGKAEINALYKKLKESPKIKELIVCCSKLKRHHRYIDDINDLKDNFIGQEPGLSFVIFDFSSLDLKKIWASSNAKPIVKKYILNVIHLLYKDSYSIYKTVTSPDVDIKEFSRLLLDSIKHLQTQPGLNRCSDAFKAIANSVDLLEDNFDGYFRESVASANPNMILESFIIDVSNKSKPTPTLTGQFRTIISFMKNQTRQRGKQNDPKIQQLFKLLNHNFDLMEKKCNDKSSDKAGDKSSGGAGDKSSDEPSPDDDAKTPVLSKSQKKNFKRKQKRTKKVAADDDMTKSVILPDATGGVVLPDDHSSDDDGVDEI